MEQGNSSDSVINEKNKKKRPFNKRKWREQKYSKRQKIEQWQERRKKAALHKYHKMLKKEKGGEVATNNRSKENSRYFKSNKYKEALMEYERKCKEREEKRQEAIRIKAEKEAARQQSHALRAERQRKLAKKTRKGQPVMKDRLEIMLEKIQKMQ